MTSRRNRSSRSPLTRVELSRQNCPKGESVDRVEQNLTQVHFRTTRGTRYYIVRVRVMGLGCGTCENGLEPRPSRFPWIDHLGRLNRFRGLGPGHVSDRYFWRNRAGLLFTGLMQGIFNSLTVIKTLKTKQSFTPHNIRNILLDRLSVSYKLLNIWSNFSPTRSLVVETVTHLTSYGVIYCVQFKTRFYREPFK